MEETAKGAVGAVRDGSGRLWTKRHKGTSVNSLPNRLPLGSILGIKFPRENHEEIVRERRRERGRRLEEEPVVVVFDLFRPSSDRVKQVLENGYHTEGEGEGTSAWKMNP
ncbi:hypothetical protein Bca4012_007560 [Brassica carinata]